MVEVDIAVTSAIIGAVVSDEVGAALTSLESELVPAEFSAATL